MKYIADKGEPLVKAIMSKEADNANKTSSYLIGLLDYLRTATSQADMPARSVSVSRLIVYMGR